MPRTLPTGMQAELSKHGGFVDTILLDIQTSDGSTFFWTDVEGVYPTRIVAGTQFYLPWVKSAGPFKRTRDLSTDSGDLVLQNLSGNTIDRDVASALKNHEFEGALAVVRFWSPLIAAARDELHMTLSEQNPREDEVSFRMLQLFDTSQYDVAGDVQDEICTWRYKSPQCGATDSATSCTKFFSDCVVHGAVERFNAIVTIVPNVAVTTPPTQFGGGGNRGGSDRIPPRLLRPLVR
ncbi:MAG TPA: hypothetical protein VKZ53_13145 [Candidatus Angelobacter sp.]|nr:hypothetical protein [Candidatus Angelobacter sp.]